MIAGDYISDPEAVRQVVMGGPEGIKDLSSKEVLHKDIIEKDDMEEKVQSILIG